ncbi:MAG: hypothetical protein Q9157_002951 [Trypethelium eluteriae]
MDPTKLSPEMLENYPAMKPPPGKTTDLHNPGKDGSNATQTIIVTAVLTGVTVFVLLLRLWTKLLVVRSPGWDDFFSHGFGYHEWNVPLGTLVDLTDCRRVEYPRNCIPSEAEQYQRHLMGLRTGNHSSNVRAGSYNHGWMLPNPTRTLQIQPSAQLKLFVVPARVK